MLRRQTFGGGEHRLARAGAKDVLERSDRRVLFFDALRIGPDRRPPNFRHSIAEQTEKGRVDLNDLSRRARRLLEATSVPDQSKLF